MFFSCYWCNKMQVVRPTGPLTNGILRCQNCGLEYNVVQNDKGEFYGLLHNGVFFNNNGSRKRVDQ